MSGMDELAAIERALRALDDPPPAPGWNHVEIGDLLGIDARRAAAVFVPLVPRANGTTVLFTLRTEGLRNHAGQVSFPGGRIERGDADAIAAALRETEEEIGIARALLRPCGFLDRFDTVSGFSVTPVVGRVPIDYLPMPDPNEVAEVFEVPLAFLLDRANLRRFRIDWHGRPREIYEYDHAGRRIWGATAAMLVNLLQRLEHSP